MNSAQDLVSGRYRLLEIIGTGGMGRVWLADDELLRRRVAVKEIATPTGVSNSELLDVQLATMREARAAARLEHPGVVGVYDVVWRPDRSWIVMEYVESQSLHDAVRTNGPISHRETARIGLGILAALRAAHDAGVLHRDVKPHNVLLATDGRVVLTDFGLAKVTGAEHGPDPLLGSPYFVAPERLQGAESTPAADLWSLGATLYAAVEGQAPFQRTTTTASLAALVTEPPDPARFPGPLTPIIDELLNKDPERRLTAEAAEARLRRVLDRAVGIFPMRVPRPRARSTMSAAAAVLPATAFAAPSEVAPAAPQAPAPAAADRRRMTRTTKISVGTAAVLLVASVGTALAVDLQPGATAPPTATTAAMTSSSLVCAAGGPPVSGTTQTKGYAVPAGWLWHADPTGFDVAVPKGWTRSQDGTAACFRDPGGSRSLRVDASARLSGPALTYWQSQEQSVLSRHALPGYERVAMEAVPEKGGAGWEFTWQPPGEAVRRHEKRVLLSMGDGRAYLVEWTTRDQDWAGDEPYLQLVLASLD